MGKIAAGNTREFLHARERLRERYGLEWSAADFESLVALIVSGARMRCLTPISHGGRYRRFALAVGPRWVPFLYDQRKRYIVTVLPAAALENHQARLSRRARFLTAIPASRTA